MNGFTELKKRHAVPATVTFWLTSSSRSSDGGRPPKVRWKVSGNEFAAAAAHSGSYDASWYGIAGYPGMKPARAPFAAVRSISAIATSAPSSTGIIGSPTMRCAPALWKSSRTQSL